MPVRNPQFPSVPSPGALGFNARGVVVAPKFTLSLPQGRAGAITLTVHAHPIGGRWIAEPSWSLGEGALQGSHMLPNKRSQLHATRSEAVEAAMNRGLRQMQTMLGKAAHGAKWPTRFDQLRQWQAEAMREVRALTMAFTTFVLFQFFNVFNARSEIGSAFNARFFDNRMLWMSLGGTLALQAVAVHWMPASQLFGTTGMAWADWGVAIGVASAVLLLEETRKLVVRAFQSRRQ
jgi:hypothetical protein